MLFNSLEFLIFFPVVVAIYFAVPHRFRWMLLLAASYYFYMCWKAEYVFLIILSTLIDYFAGIRMGMAESKRIKRKYLMLSLLTNLGLLFSFKYFNFFNDSTRVLFNNLDIFYGIPSFDILLPVGISFYTFQTLSYSIDVYRGVKQPERHLGIFALYVSFFPQLVAGPIERSTRLLPQFYKPCEFESRRVIEGLRQMLWGFFKKIVIADRLAIYVNQVYNNPADFGGAPLLLATYFFAIQIYCDFSGYSDIAIGAAKVMGYDLMENFRRPYFSKSISEFWMRWHISLSSWFKDYLYIPLGGNRVVKWRWYFNLFVVFVVSGFWHGANWTFMIWGALHGTYLIVSNLTKNVRRQIMNILRLSRHHTFQKFWKTAVTFHLVLLAWIFFRANSLSDAFYILQKILALKTGNLLADLASGFNRGSIAMGWAELMISFSTIALMIFVHIIESRFGVRKLLSGKPRWLRWTADYSLIVGIIVLGVFKHAEFIYFQF